MDRTDWVTHLQFPFMIRSHHSWINGKGFWYVCVWTNIEFKSILWLQLIPAHTYLHIHTRLSQHSYHSHLIPSPLHPILGYHPRSPPHTSHHPHNTQPGSSPVSLIRQIGSQIWCTYHNKIDPYKYVFTTETCQTSPSCVLGLLCPSCIDHHVSIDFASQQSWAQHIVHSNRHYI